MSTLHLHIVLRQLLLSFFIYSPETYLAHVEQGLPTLPEHLSSLQVFSSVRADRSLAFFVMLCRSVVCPFILLTIALSVPFRLTTSDYPFGIFKLFLAIC